MPLGKDFEKGLQKALHDHADAASVEIELVREFIGQGGVKQTEDIISKLFSYDGVDMITGILSGRATEKLAVKFSQQQKPLLVNNLGAYVPDVASLNSYVFLNSQHLWQHAWAMGYWGVQQFGKKGMFIGGVYDSGYSFSHMFYEGMIAADPQSEWSFSIPPMPPAGKLSDMSVIFPYLEQYQPDFIFAAFCGKETTLFLNEFISRGWHKKTAVTGLPYLVTPFEPLNDDITIYTTLPDASAPDAAADKSFYRFGYQTGTMIAEAAAHPGSMYEGLQQSTHNLVLNNGQLNCLSFNDADADEIVILRNNITAHSREFTTETAGKSRCFSLQDEHLGTLTAEIPMGWLNPYLFI
jgi:branched-chain amino acid transport system substrate-binding protein